MYFVLKKFKFQQIKVIYFSSLLKEKRTNLKKPNSERIGHSFRVKFNPLALLLDASLEGEFDLVQRIIYEVCRLLFVDFTFP